MISNRSQFNHRKSRDMPTEVYQTAPQPALATCDPSAPAIGGMLEFSIRRPPYLPHYCASLTSTINAPHTSKETHGA